MNAKAHDIFITKFRPHKTDTAAPPPVVTYAAARARSRQKPWQNCAQFGPQKLSDFLKVTAIIGGVRKLFRNPR